MQFVSAKKVRKMLYRERKVLRHLQKARRCNTAVLQNLSFWEKEAQAVLHDLRTLHALPADDAGMPRLFSLLFRLTKGGVLPSFSAVVQALKPFSLQADELDLTAVFLRAALLLRAAQYAASAPDAARKAAEQLHTVYAFPFSDLFAALSPAEAVLQTDAGYAHADGKTKSACRRLLSLYAGRTGVCEAEAAQAAALRAKETGVGLFTLLCRAVRPKSSRLLLLAEPLLSLLLAVLLSFLCGAPLCILLWWFPLWGICAKALEPLFLKHTPPIPVPAVRPEFIKDAEAKTVLAVTTLLPPAAHADALLHHIEEIYLSTGQSRAKVCVLADLRTASAAQCPEDAADTAAVKQGIDRLNRLHGAHFLLALRPRVYSEAQGTYSGYERKRGAILALLHAFRADRKAFCTFYGALEDLENTRYLFTLDSDTDLEFGCLDALLCAAEYPDNFPKMQENAARITEGYGIFVPRVEVSLSAALRTKFSRAFCGVGGISGYDAAVGELFADLFGASQFVGKGLLRVDTALCLLEDAFAEDTVLSHDILEGELLRTALVPTAQVTDAFPTHADAYFARMERWMRGDAQNLAFLGRHILTTQSKTPSAAAHLKNSHAAEQRQNPFSLLSKWKILDNVRRSSTPVFLFFALLYTLLLPARSANAVLLFTLFLLCFSPLFSLLSLLLRGEALHLGFHYFGKALSAVQKAAVDMLTALLYLPRTAYTALRALILGLYRRFFSHKNTLDWTTAADADLRKSNLQKRLQAALPALCSFLLFALLGRPILKCIALFFLAEPLFSYSSEKPCAEKPHKKPTAEEEAYLLNCGGAMWQYFATYCTAENHNLPPDNIQLAPTLKLARRTSPTNIGLYLAALLAAYDLKFISLSELLRRCSQTLTTVEGLPKYRGNLYNWYSTQTLEPLPPAFVSAVDSGNFLCALTALRAGLQADVPSCEQVQSIIERLTRLLDETDLGFLYDSRQNLFYIGFDAEAKAFTPAHYDLLMSESRMMSYYAVARRLVPEQHWAALSRITAQSAVHAGALAWSGTAFEYFMPFLFLESPPNSLSREALSFSLHMQRLYAKKRGIPFGISESAYFALDEAGNFQYRAHGVPQTALRPDPFDAPVTAPYASFLFLPFGNTSEIVKNLLSLEEQGALGPYGFFEAVDYRRKIARQAQSGQVVRSFMAHHVAMSLLALDNACKENIMQKRFLKDSAMHGAKSLLAERVPAVRFSFSAYKSSKRAKKAFRKGLNSGSASAAPVLPKHAAAAVQPLSAEPCSVLPAMCLYSNGLYSLLLTDGGAGFARLGDSSITRENLRPDLSPLGIYAFFQTENGTFPLCRSASAHERGDISYRTVFAENKALYFADTPSLRAQTQVAVHATLPAEVRSFSLCNPSDRPLAGEFYIYLEPSLTSDRAERAHKAFQKLFVSAACLPHENALLFQRHTREGEAPLFAACGFSEPADFRLLCARNHVLQRQKPLEALTEAPFFGREDFAAADVCFCVKVRIYIEPKQTKHLHFYLAAAAEKNVLFQSIGQLKKESPVTNFADALFYGSSDFQHFSQLLPYLFMQTALLPARRRALAENQGGLSVLWSLGISGDRPPVCCVCRSAADVAALSFYIKAFAQLRRIDFGFDLVLLSEKETLFTGECKRRLLDLLKEESPAQAQEKTPRGSLFFLSAGALTQAQRRTLSAFSVWTDEFPSARICFSAAALQKQEEVQLQSAFCALPLAAGEPPAEVQNSCTETGCRIVQRSDFPWCYVLANPSFSVLAEDGALGTSFAVNSRLMKLTAYRNDPLSVHTGERLYLKYNGTIYDLLHRCETIFGENQAVYRVKLPFCLVEITVRVPQKGMAKRIAVRLQSTESYPIAVEIAYYTLPWLGEDSRPAFLQSSYENNLLFLKNSAEENCFGYVCMRAQGGEGTPFYTVQQRAFFSGNWHAGGSLPQALPCAAVGCAAVCPSKGTAVLSFTLSFGRTKAGAAYPLSVHKSGLPLDSRLILSAPKPSFNVLCNTFLVPQILCGRLFCRSGFYQSGGAYGFRDQLQDAMSLLLLAPKFCKRQIFRCCAVQFPHGDVLHWWHPDLRPDKGVAGVRTRCSDDMLWLPLALARYVLSTEDTSVLTVQIRYLKGEPLQKTESERYTVFAHGTESASVLAHAELALQYALQKIGAHGLLCIGTGDWNDGLSGVGKEGRGESVWLTEFAVLVLSQFAALYTLLHCPEKAKAAADHADVLRRRIDREAFAGDRYLRAFYDDGEAMGAAESKECQIDSLSQSFAVFAGLPNRKRIRTALLTAYHALLDRKNGIFKLFTPAFSGENKKAGYIAAYPQGLRENGGQYTHAAVWFCRALFEAGLSDEGTALLHLLNPMEKYETAAGGERYKTEPYFFAGDVYSARHLEGQGGWSIYTGSAGQFYAMLTEVILGIEKRGSRLYFHPVPPTDWGDFSYRLELGGVTLTVEVCAVQTGRLLADGKSVPYLVLDGKNHHIKCC